MLSHMDLSAQDVLNELARRFDFCLVWKKKQRANKQSGERGDAGFGSPIG